MFSGFFTALAAKWPPKIARRRFATPRCCRPAAKTGAARREAGTGWEKILNGRNQTRERAEQNTEQREVFCCEQYGSSGARRRAGRADRPFGNGNGSAHMGTSIQSSPDVQPSGHVGTGTYLISLSVIRGRGPGHSGAGKISLKNS